MILKNMREHSSALVQQTIMVSEELIRVAILWHEQWHEGVEDTSRWVGWGGLGVQASRWVGWLCSAIPTGPIVMQFVILTSVCLSQLAYRACTITSSLWTLVNMESTLCGIVAGYFVHCELVMVTGQY